jgi:regulator of PEP synthase PpsR (kinase-PPPase family)
VIKDIEASPGIVLYTIFNKELAEELEQSCKALKIPCVPALQKILQVFESYLGTPSTPTVGGQHVLDADYFARIEALNFTMVHDDGHLPENLDDADIILVGISRTSKTPTSIYLANRGFKTANVPLFLACHCRRSSKIRPRRLSWGWSRRGENRQVRNRVIEHAHTISTTMWIARRSRRSRRDRQLCARRGWPIIDVTRRSIEETAAAILRLYQDRTARRSSDKGLPANRKAALILARQQDPREIARGRRPSLYRRAAGPR